jgi:MGT family glycosyltransferase
MKVLFAVTPAVGHVNPMLVAARVLQNAGHETAFYTGKVFREKIESRGIRFFPLPADVDYDTRNLDDAFPERQRCAPGPERLLFDLKSVVVDAMPSQFKGLQTSLREFPADLVVHESGFCGVLPLLLDPRASRPWSACLGVTPLLLPREDGLPFGPGLPPAVNAAQKEQYSSIARHVERTVLNPVREHADQLLSELGAPKLPAPVFESIATLADVILQPCVPSFEFALRRPQEKLHFIGALLPEGSGDVPPELLEAKKAGRKIILVSQGTIANGDLRQLVAPVIKAFGDRKDFLILVTTGGKPVEAIPCSLPANTIASRYLNFSQVLPHVDVLVAFGGYGTVTQALHFGVPMVVAGQTEDKPDVAARVAWSGAGVYLRTDDPTVHQVRNAVEHILSEPDFRARTQKIALEFRSYNAARELRLLLGTLVAEGQPIAV